jgi:hypothetical protein
MVFGEWQRKYAECNIITFPVKADEKKPGVSNFLKAGLRASAAWADRLKFADYAIGFCPGLRNGITVLDVDTTDESVLEEALHRHGDTPIVIRTASDKAHAWYRYDGEGRCIRPWDGLPIDVLGDRNGINNGYVVAPPSRRGNGTEYRFMRGGLSEVINLPAMRNVDELKRAEPLVLPDDVAAAEEPAAEGTRRKIREGNRDNSLWRACMAQAKQVQTFDELLAFSRTYNEENMQPALADNVCLEKSYSAWKYEQLGLNTFGQRAVVVPGRLMNASPDAQWLFTKLQRDFFWSEGSSFPVPKDYASKYGMGWRRQYNAMRELIASRSIRRVGRGGRFEGDAATYAWVRKGEPGGWANE